MNTNNHDIVVARVLGNYTPPKSSRVSRLTELSYILEKEKEINFKRIWVLNRIFDTDYLNDIKLLLEKFRHDHIEIPFLYNEYKPLGTFEHKFHYLTNINNARNVAIEEGLSRGKYLFCLDGDCFFTSKLFDYVCKGLSLWGGNFNYYALMAKRIPVENGKPNFNKLIDSEPMLAFTKASKEKFDESIPFGQNDKNDLCWKLGFNKDKMINLIYDSNTSGNLCKTIGDIYHISFSDPEIETNHDVRKNIRKKSKEDIIQIVKERYEGSN